MFSFFLVVIRITGYVNLTTVARPPFACQAPILTLGFLHIETDLFQLGFCPGPETIP